MAVEDKTAQTPEEGMVTEVQSEGYQSPRIKTGPSSQVPLEEVRAYLDYLMQEHTHQAVRNNNQGALPYARLSPAEEQ